MIIGIIQARMGSTRLPGKVLKEIDGVPLLLLQIVRVKKTSSLDNIIIATSTLPQDDAISQFCSNNTIECFRGSEDDVLNRYYECAKKYEADVIVRLTSDCPLSDPKIIDKTVALFQQQKADYAANTVPLQTSTFPDGSDVEVFSLEALEKAHRECKDAHDREHVTFYFWKYDNGFKTVQLIQKEDWSKFRFTVDYPEDLEVIEYVVAQLKQRDSFGHLAEIVEIIESNPEIRDKNSQYYSGIGWNKYSI